GQYPLDLTVTDTAGTLASCFTSPLSIALNTNQSTTIDCTNRCNAAGTVNYAVAVAGTALQSLGHVCDVNILGQRIVARSTCDTCVTCVGTLAIKVYKQVVCWSNTCEAFDNNLLNQKSTTGVRIDPANDADCPAFCYRIVVTNLGTLTLSNLVVVDTN